MYSFRRLALALALASAVLSGLKAQSPDSSSNPAPATQQAPSAAQSQPQISVQARIKARREQRRAAAIHETYDHRYEGYVGMGYLRFRPGATLQKVNEYDWNGGVTRYFSERLGATVDGRGYYGTPFIRPEQGDPPAGSVGLDKPTISQYAVLLGPTYRFYLQPKYSVSGRVMGGFTHGNFTGDTNGYGTLGVLYPSTSTFAASASIFVEYNLSPALGFRVAPEYYVTGFGSSLQNNLGYSVGLVVRVGKQ
ncbi:MAG: hypothetical protein P4L26_11620 [Terracidiphilus sp.]|nr:hypothetical protein [Terracidiphilus sp.]